MKTLLCVFCILCASMSLSAQTFRGGIQGTVTDATGHPVGDALVTVNNEETGLTRTAKTSSAGTYFISELPIGNYDIKVDKTGSHQQILKGIKVEVSANQRVDFQLKPGAGPAEEEKTATQVVEMTGQSPLINATQDNLGGTIGAKQLQDLPVNGRDFEHLFALIPGVTSDASLSTDS